MFLQVLEEKEESKIKELYSLDGESDCAGGNALLVCKGTISEISGVSYLGMDSSCLLDRSDTYHVFTK